MPIHVYKCRDCSHEFEVRGSFEICLSNNVVCPTCASINVNKKFYPFNIIYRGEGFTKSVKGEN